MYICTVINLKKVYYLKVIYLIYTKTLQAVGEDLLAAFSVFILSYRCPAKEPDSDIGIYTLLS